MVHYFQNKARNEVLRRQKCARGDVIAHGTPEGNRINTNKACGDIRRLRRPRQGHKPLLQISRSHSRHAASMDVNCNNKNYVIKNLILFIIKIKKLLELVFSLLLILFYKK
jgi:hypothetical protein